RERSFLLGLLALLIKKSLNWLVVFGELGQNQCCLLYRAPSGESISQDPVQQYGDPHGTYHAWLSIEVDPKERDHYRCYVAHTALPEPLVLAWKEPGEKKKVG
uniref:Immunoglobulin C1-set domain-containing protein n=1 Tax=Laticauda laticaudata TaxID=8630 RepID=A0A8C5WSP3_LATLA